MRALSLIDNYMPVGDASVCILCMVLLFVLYVTYGAKDYGKRFFNISILMISCASVCNLFFYFILKDKLVFEDSTVRVILLYGFKYMYQTIIMIVNVLLLDYIMHLITNNTKTISKFRLTSLGILIFFTVLNTTSWYTGLGLYYDANTNLWYKNYIYSPYNLSYICFIGVLITMLLMQRKNVIRQVRITLIFSEFFCILIACITIITQQDSYTTLTTLIPFIVLLIMLQATPYDINTGALSVVNFNNTIVDAYTENHKLHYITIEIITDKHDFKLNNEQGKFFYNFWENRFYKPTLFKLKETLFVLTLNDSLTPAIKKNILFMIEQTIIPFLKANSLSYKIVGMLDIDYLKKSSDFDVIYDYISSTMDCNTYKIIDNENRSEYADITYILDELQDINEKQDLNDPRVLVYCQPVLNVVSKGYDTAEALMRLTLDKTDFVTPNKFITLAEKYDLIHSLSLIIFNKTCKFLHDALKEGFNIDRISVNFSVMEFRLDNFCDEIIAIIEKNDIPFNKIAIEITESNNDEDYAFVQSKIYRLQKLGIKFYLDDFGTGYSNFDRLLGLNLDVVKFDRSLLLYSDKDERADFVLKHFSEAFESLEYKILFEGVETEEQENLCINSHADYLQGFKFSKPIPIDEFTKYLSKAM